MAPTASRAGRSRGGCVVIGSLVPVLGWVPDATRVPVRSSRRSCRAPTRNACEGLPVQDPRRWRSWREAMDDALYGADGFYRRSGAPAAHFRTAAHASPLWADAVAELAGRVDEALGEP